MTEQQQIQKLLASSRYDVNIIPKLENYVIHQVETASYDLEANLALLKLYQFNPEKTNNSIISQILIKAMMNLPNTDFLLCMYLVSEKSQMNDAIATIVSLEALLEKAQFKEFWRQYKEKKQLFSVSGFEEAIRNFILELLRRTYRSISRGYLADIINLKEGPELEALLNSHPDWKYTSDTVTFPVDSQAKPKPSSETLKFEQLTKILQSLS
jgi:translation initiation factor 3 subunit K